MTTLQRTHYAPAKPDYAEPPIAAPRVIAGIAMSAQLSADLFAHYERERDDLAHHGFAVPASFSAWVCDILATRIYGAGVDSGAAADWLEHQRESEA